MYTNDIHMQMRELMIIWYDITDKIIVVGEKRSNKLLFQIYDDLLLTGLDWAFLLFYFHFFVFQ